MWGNQSYHSLSYKLKQVFGEKIVKLSLDGGFTCPNRDGVLGIGGCIFCGEQGSGDFAAATYLPIEEQILEQQKLLARKWPQAKYLAYFQNFTATYATPSRLIRLYSEALSAPNIVGLAIGTRCDCLPPETLALLESYAQKTYLWVELGLQTSNFHTHQLLKTGYTPTCFAKAVHELHRRQIKVVAHLILGLPGESRQTMLKSVRFVSDLGVWGIKLHLLHIQRDTALYHLYQNKPFRLLEQNEYIKLICDILEHLPPEMVIHRLTGDGNKDLLVEPRWSLDKMRVLSAIEAEMRRRNTVQGNRIG